MYYKYKLMLKFSIADITRLSTDSYLIASFLLRVKGFNLLDILLAKSINEFYCDRTTTTLTYY